MAVEDIEKRVRAMTGKKDIPDDKQQAAFQSAQNELVRINSERQNNLALTNAEANADAQVNETLLQAGEMASMGSPAVQQQVESMNPQTQAVLSKYGLGKPRVQRTQGREVKVTPQKVQITNNNITNTTNNVSVPPANVGGPVQGRTLAVKQADPEQARFKTWIQSAFARQNAKAAQREKEYQRKEWSLSRSANKMMKYLSDLGSNISEKLNPNKMAATVGGQFKTILFLFGTMFLAKHWKKVIDIGASIERFFLGEVISRDEKGKVTSRGEPGIKTFFRDIFGGKTGEPISKSIFKFFYSGDQNNAGIFDLVLLKIKQWFEEGSEAVKSLELPKIDTNNLLGSFSGLIKYFGDVITTLFTGGRGLKKAIDSQVKEVSDKSKFGLNREGKDSSWIDDRVDINKSFTNYDTSSIKEQYGLKDASRGNIAYGDVIHERDKDSTNYLRYIDLDKNGNLTGTVGSGFRATNSVVSMLRDSDTVNTVGVTSMLKTIEEGVKKGERNGGNGLAVESSKFFSTTGLTPSDVEELKKSGDIKEGKFKYIIREKSLEELAQEYKGIKKEEVDPEIAAINAGLKTELENVTGIGGLKKIGWTVLGTLGGLALCLTPGGQAIGIPMMMAAGAGVGALTGTLAQNTALRSGMAYVLNTKEARAIPRYKVELVPSTDPRPGLDLGGNWASTTTVAKNPKDQTIVNGFWIKSGVINKIKDNIGGFKSKDSNGNITYKSFDIADSEVRSHMDSFTRSTQKQLHGKVSKNVDYPLENYKNVEKIDKIIEENKAEFNQARNNSRPVKAVNQVIEGATNAYNGIVNYFSGEKEDNVKYPPIAKSDEEFVNKMRKIYSDILAKKGIDQKYVDALVAQDTLESNWGKSQSGKFNFGGVTVSDRLAKSGKVSYTVKRANGDGKLKKWRNFDSVEDYANYHVRLLNTDKGFSIPYHAFDGNDVNDFINRIVNNGYAQEGKKYGDALAIRYSQVQNVPQESGTQNLPDNTQQSTTSPDASGVYIAQNITEPENYVERIPSSANYTTYDWNSSNSSFSNWNGDNEALAMAAKNASSTITPDSATPTNASYNSYSSYDTPSANTARELVANNDMTEIAKGISGKIGILNENIKVLQTGQLAQAESINNLSAAIGNIQINVNTGGQQKTPVQSATGIPYRIS